MNARTIQAVLLALVIPVVLLATAAALQEPPVRPLVDDEAEPRGRTPGAGAIVVVETTRGTFEFETYPDEAPRTVEHVLALVKRGFYDGLRFHRVEPGFVIQVGDPQTRDPEKRKVWGTGGSGTPVGVAELSRKRRHTIGAVAMAHSGNAAAADAQFYVTLAPVPRLDGNYTVFGRVIGGTDVPAGIEVGDRVTRMYVKP